MRQQVILLLAAGLVVLLSGSAWSAVSCHCFQDRTYDPARPSAADAYFLATAQNSLIAAALNVSKRNIVQSKMGGADADLLWVTYYLSDRTGLDVADMIELWTTKGIDGLIAKQEKLSMDFDKPFLTALSPAADLKQLARGAYVSVMSVQLGVERPILERLALHGASRKEQILAIFISFLLGEDPSGVYKSIKTGKQTWGQAFTSTGLEPKQIEPTWRKLLKLHQAGLT
jgi:hypothetical protein